MSTIERLWIPAFVLTRNMPTWSDDICSKLHAAGLEVVIVDNNSTFKPMINWLKEMEGKYVVIRINSDAGAASPYLPWMVRVSEGSSRVMSLVEFTMKFVMNINTNRYIVTDFDLDLTIGDGLIGIMGDFMDRHDVTKVGLSLSWQDHNYPWHMYEFLDKVERYNAQLSEKIIETVEYSDVIRDYFENVTAYDAPIDTTFAMYDLTRPFEPMNPGPHFPGRGIRLSLDGSGAVHRPWTQHSGYVMADIEQYYYVMSCGDGVGYWTSMMKKLIESKMNMIRLANYDIKYNRGYKSKGMSINIGDRKVDIRPFLDEATGDYAFKVV